jgi:hypothetical protein
LAGVLQEAAEPYRQQLAKEIAAEKGRLMKILRDFYKEESTAMAVAERSDKRFLAQPHAVRLRARPEPANGRVGSRHDERGDGRQAARRVASCKPRMKPRSRNMQLHPPSGSGENLTVLARNVAGGVYIPNICAARDFAAAGPWATPQAVCGIVCGPASPKGGPRFG